MSVHVALLRAVNVAGYGKIKMADLRDAFTAAGYSDVSTYIQSGNVVFSSSAAVESGEVTDAVSAELGTDVTILVRTAVEIAAVPDRNPFPDVDRSTIHVGFLLEDPPATELEALNLEGFSPEKALVSGTEVYFHLPDGMGRAKLPAQLNKRLSPPMTVRNWNTVTSLVEMASAAAG